MKNEVLYLEDVFDPRAVEESYDLGDARPSRRRLVGHEQRAHDQEDARVGEGPEPGGGEVAVQDELLGLLPLHLRDEIDDLGGRSLIHSFSGAVSFVAMPGNAKNLTTVWAMSNRFIMGKIRFCPFLMISFFSVCFAGPALS